MDGAVEEYLEEYLLIALITGVVSGLIAAATFSHKGRSGIGGFFLGLSLGFLLGVIGTVVVIVIALVVSPSRKAQEDRAIQQGKKRRCPNCASVISSKVQICSSCGERLYPPICPITHDRISSLLKQIDRRALKAPPQQYFSDAQNYAHNWQVREAAYELGKVLLLSPPDSEIHIKAQKLLKGLGYREDHRRWPIGWILDILGNTDQGLAQYVWKAVLIDVIPTLVIGAIIIAIALAAFPELVEGETIEESFEGVPIIFFLLYLVILGPLIETLLMWPVLAVLRWFTSDKRFLVLGSALLWALLHSLAVPVWGLTIFWPFVVFSLVFVEWEKKSTEEAILATACVHMCHNLLAAILLVALWNID